MDCTKIDQNFWYILNYISGAQVGREYNIMKLTYKKKHI